MIHVKNTDGLPISELDNALSANGLDFTVHLGQMEYQGTPRNSYGVFRDDNGIMLGDGAKAGYQPVQISRYADILKAYLGATPGTTLGTMGYFGDGQKFWLSGKVPYDFEVTPGDKQVTYMNMQGSHDMTIQFSGVLSAIRIVCRNTFYASLAGFKAIREKHTRNVEVRLADIEQAASKLPQSVETLKTQFRLLADRQMTRESTNTILDKLFGFKGTDKDSTRTENIVKELLGIYEENDNDAFPVQRGTAYNLFNSVTNYVDHKRTTRLTDRMANTSKEVALEAARVESSMIGSGNALKIDALEVILQATAGNPTHHVVYSTPNTSLLDSIISNS